MRVIGPPGTGKTTFLQEKIEELSQSYHSDEFCLTSFTKAAAKVLSLRIGNLDGIGTLHSLCYENVGRPQIAETNIKEWNEKHPEFELSEHNKKTVDDMAVEDMLQTKADKVFSSIQIRRAMMHPIDDWTSEEQKFYGAWYRLSLIHI